MGQSLSTHQAASQVGEEKTKHVDMLAAINKNNVNDWLMSEVVNRKCPNITTAECVIALYYDYLEAHVVESMFELGLRLYLSADSTRILFPLFKHNVDLLLSEDYDFTVHLKSGSEQEQKYRSFELQQENDSSMLYRSTKNLSSRLELMMFDEGLRSVFVNNPFISKQLEQLPVWINSPGSQTRRQVVDFKVEETQLYIEDKRQSTALVELLKLKPAYRRFARKCFCNTKIRTTLMRMAGPGTWRNAFNGRIEWILRSLSEWQEEFEIYVKGLQDILIRMPVDVVGIITEYRYGFA